MILGITFDEFADTFSLPDGPPEISYPFKGDSIPGKYPWFIQNPVTDNYQTVALGEGFNVQPFNANAKAFIIEQDFFVRMATYTPMPLNTPYQVEWSLDWLGPVDLSEAILVAEGRLEVMPGGIARLRRTFANVPPQRNSYESFTFQFPGYTTNGGTTRQPFSITINSRLQYDYFLMTAEDELPPVFQQFLVYAPVDGAVGTRNVLNPPFLSDADAADPDSFPTTPALADYALIIGNAEIIVESSCLRPWMANIYERVTRFALAQ